MWRTSSFAAIAMVMLSGTQSWGQLIYQESFETNGDGSRYELSDPGFEFSGDSGPAMWTHNFEAEQIGLQQNAPAKRAGILWDATVFEDLVSDTDALDIWSSLVSWSVDGKANATVGILGDSGLDGNATVLERLEADGHTVEDFFDPLDLEGASIDVLIHANDIASTALSELAIPIISYSATDHDDTAIAGIGATVDFFDPVSLPIPAAAEGHPVLAGKTGSLSWVNDAAVLQTVGKPHNGGTVLATVTYEDLNTGEDVETPALFVVEEGGALLGAFNPDPEGDGYFVGAALNKFGDGVERTLDLNAVDVAGRSDVKLTVALAATAADFETADYLRLEVDPDGSGPEGFTVLEEFFGVTVAGDCLSGLSNGEVPGEEGEICLTDDFNDYEWDIPEGATDLVVRFAALSTWGNEIVAIDNVRIHSGALGPDGDFNANGMLDAGDLDLLAAGINAADSTFDVNGDGSVNASDRQFWLADLKGTWVGDANLDGEFNSGDFVTVFTEGLFEADADAGWAQGDWNGDGRFNSSDFVAAFTDGGFELGPRAATAAVPEPASATLLLLGMLAFVRRRRR